MRMIVVTITGSLLSGCAGWWAPESAIQAPQFASTLEKQAVVIGYLRTVAPGSGYAARDYLTLAKWGFNVGRDDCEAYLHNLFLINRRKQRNNLLLAAANGATSAIVTATTSGQKPLSIIAAAFDFASAANAAISDSFLFSEAPGLVALKVKQLQDAYRNHVENGSIPVESDADVYKVIHTYYSICLPPYIEGILLDRIANSAAVITTGSQSQTQLYSESLMLRGSAASAPAAKGTVRPNTFPLLR
ncbi:hypothetical protein [Rhodoplanes elegans]|nr:hypothetical protein [Rhodoplanes elegans]